MANLTEQGGPSPTSFPEIADLQARFEGLLCRHEEPRIEDFLNRGRPDDRPALLVKLLLAEWSQRGARGQPIELAVCVSRFPLFAEAVQSAWQLWHAQATRPLTEDWPATKPSEGWPSQPLSDVAPDLPGYEEVELLGKGGMGVVYRARDPRLNRLVAIKRIQADDPGPEWLKRFRTEAKALACLQHPHIVQVFNWEEHAGRPCLIMEYVSGGSLEDRLRRGPLRPVEAAGLVAVLARAVQHAHEQGIVHRDLKPANVLLAPPVAGSSGTVLGSFPKVGDFGLARLAREHNQTTTGLVIGTPAYMSPEQAAGRLRAVAAPTDVWALGVILYRCLAGKLPFKGDTLLETLDRVKTSAPQPLPQASPGVPAELVDVCDRCLDKSTDRRPTAQELAEKLERFLAATSAADGKAQPRDVRQEGPPRPRRKPWGVAELAGGLVLVGFLAAWWFVAFRAERAATAMPSIKLRVRLYRDANGASARSVGEVGRDTFAANYGDVARLEVELPEPAWPYLIAYNPDGTEELLWPVDRPTGNANGKVAPEKVTRFAYSSSQGDYFRLTHERAGGLQAFAVVVSRKPLPGFAEWAASRGQAVWQGQQRFTGAWSADLEGVYALGEGGDRRGAVGRSTGPPPLRELVEFLRVGGVVGVEVCALPVAAKKEK